MCKVNRLIKQVVITVEQRYNEGDTLQEHITRSMGKSTLPLGRGCCWLLLAAAWLRLQVQQKLILMRPYFSSAAALHMLVHTRLRTSFFKIKGRVILYLHTCFPLEAIWC